eukprot:3028318-Alexandrium_andersonii.AAC.1
MPKGKPWADIVECDDDTPDPWRTMGRTGKPNGRNAPVRPPPRHEQPQPGAEWGRSGRWRCLSCGLWHSDA